MATRRRNPTEEVSFEPVDNARLAALCEPLDANLRQIETALDVTIARRGERFGVSGPKEKAIQAARARRTFRRIASCAPGRARRCPGAET
jgi:phosphate starvation-inducible protein PhoH and related proteins